MKTLIFAALAALTTPGAQPSAELFAKVRDALDEQLFDYPSTRFREVTADDAVVCGRLNAKNRMGAYTGWTRFGAFYRDGKVSLYVDDPSSPPPLLDLFCGGDRIPQSPDYSDRLMGR